MSILPATILSCALGALGWLSYLKTGRKSATALIPSFFGIVIGMTALIGSVLEFSAVTRWVVLVVVFLGLLGTIRGLASWIRGAISGQPAGAASVSKGLMSLLCAAYLIWMALA